jgi:hypothetical protein
MFLHLIAKKKIIIIFDMEKKISVSVTDGDITFLHSFCHYCIYKICIAAQNISLKHSHQ